jgi:hypothetical protein
MNKLNSWAVEKNHTEEALEPEAKKRTKKEILRVRRQSLNLVHIQRVPHE